MSHRGPWSVKGIDQRARDAAREAAREEGLTLGEYLNNLLMKENDNDMNDISRPFETRSPEPEAATNSLDSLTRRIEAAEARSTLAITGIDQSVLGLLARLENSEQNQSDIASHVDGVIDDLRSTHDALREKVRELEADDSNRQNLEALKALENALGKLASHVYEENALAQNEAEAVKARIESGLGDVNSRLEGMETKVEETLSDAARRVEKAVEQAELRSEGTARHLSDRFATLETTVAEKLVRVDDMQSQMSEMQGDVSGALESMEHTLLRIQERLNRAETTTDAALKSLESTFDSLDQRIETVARHASPELAQELREQFERRFEGLAEEVRASVAATRTELADEIERAAKSASPELFTRLESSVQDMHHRLSMSEERHTRAVENVGDQVHRISQSFDQRIQSVENRNDSAAAEAVREEVAKLSDTMETRLEEMEEREAHAIEQVGSEMGKLAEHLESRVADSEHRSAEAIEHVGEQVARVASRMQTRQDEAFKTFSDKLEETQIRQDTRLSDALSNVSERLELMQEQSSASLSPVQKAIASLATRLEAIEDFSAPPFVEKRTDTFLPDMPEMPQNEPLFDEAEADFKPIDSEIETAVSFNKPEAVDDMADVFSGGIDIAPIFEEETSSAEAHGDISERYEDTPLFDEEPDNAETLLNSDTDYQEAIPSSEEDNFTPGVSSWDDLATDDTAQTRSDLEQAAEFSDDYSYENVTETVDALDTAEPGETRAEYMVDLPEEISEFDSADPVSDLEQWDDGSDEVRDSDIFETEAPNTRIYQEDETEEFEPTPYPTTAEDLTSEPDTETLDYISRARKAAQAAAIPEKSNRRKQTKSSKAASGASSLTGGSGSKLPLIAAVSAIAITTAGATAYLSMRGQKSLPVQTLNNPADEDAAAGNEAALISDSAADAGTDTDEDTEVSIPAAPVESTVAAPVTPEAEVAAETAARTDDDTPLSSLAGGADAPAQMENPSATIASMQLPPLPEIKLPTLEQAAETGNPVAMFQLGLSRLEANDYAMGANLVRRAAEAGLPAAQYRMAKLHEKGLGVPRDLVQSRRWTEQAARSGNTKAMHDLAVFFAEGEGGPQSYAGAVEWFRKAAEYGIVDSQYNLAVLYEEGLGISPNLTEALFWYGVAARQGDASAPAKITDIRARVSLEAAQQAQRRAASWQASPANAAANGQFAAQPWNDPEAARIAYVQTRLSDLGYEAGATDGAMGPSTQSAIKSYELANGLAPNGKISDTLLRSLNSRPVPGSG